MGERGNQWLRYLDYAGGIPATLPAALLRKLEKAQARPKAAPTRIGIICLGAIGDLLLLSALVNGIHIQHPNCAIELIVSTANAAATPLIPHISTAFQAPVAKPWQFISWLRSREYDILFDSSQWARLGSLLSSASKASLITGFRTEKQWRSAGYDIKVDHSSQKHEVENFLALGKAIWPDFHGEPELAIKGAPAQRKPIIYCHLHPAPGPGRQLKQWPETHWRDLIAILIGSGFKVRLTGGPADVPANDLFLSRYFARTKNVSSLAGKIAISELASHLAAAGAVVSVNTGAMHLASLAGAPTIGLHGATNPRRWGPIGPKSLSLLPDKGESAYLNLGFEYPKNAKPAMANISVERVLTALTELAGIAFPRTI